jgi:hypothetical protein
LSLSAPPEGFRFERHINTLTRRINDHLSITN